MSDMIAKSYNSIKELPSEVRSSFDERDQQKWMDAYNKASESKEPEQAKVDAWMSMVDAPSSLAVETWGSVEVRDADGELVPVKTIEEYADKFIENGGLMHDSHSNVPVGTVWDYEVRKHPETGQDGIVFYFNIYRDGEVFERARDDILSGRKNAVSIGAEAPRGGYKCDDRGCYVERDVTDLYELSICETPANPEAYFINVGKDIAKAKTPIEGEVFRIGIKDVVVHQDYTTCPLQKCKHDLLEKGFKNIHITDNGTVTAKSKKNEYKLFKAIHKMGYPFRYDLKKEQFEIMPDYGVEQAIEEAVENGWAHEDQIGHVCLTKEIPKEVFMDWYDRGFITKIGDFYCLKADDVAKEDVKKSAYEDDYWDDDEFFGDRTQRQTVLDYAKRVGEYIGSVQDGRTERRFFKMPDGYTVQICINIVDDSVTDIWRTSDFSEWNFPDLEKSSKKKVKKSNYSRPNGEQLYEMLSSIDTTNDGPWMAFCERLTEITDEAMQRFSLDPVYEDIVRGFFFDAPGNVDSYLTDASDLQYMIDTKVLGKSTKKKVKKSMDGIKQIFEQFTDDDIERINQTIKDYGGISDFADLSIVLFGLTNKSTKKKVKKDGGAMGVGDAGATNAVYGAKPASLTNPDKKYGKKKKTKKEFTDDGNIHAVGSRQAKKSYGNFFDAVENFIVDSPEGVYYNDILDEFSDALDEDDILDALEQICSDGAIIYDDRTERFKVGKRVKKSFAIFNPDDEIEMFDGKELVFDKKEDAEYVLASDEFPDGWYCTEIGDDRRPLFKNVKKSVNSIEKKCPKGKWKDKKTGECISIEEWKSKYGKKNDERPSSENSTENTPKNNENKYKNIKLKNTMGIQLTSIEGNAIERQIDELRPYLKDKSKIEVGWMYDPIGLTPFFGITIPEDNLDINTEKFKEFGKTPKVMGPVNKGTFYYNLWSYPSIKPVNDVISKLTYMCIDIVHHEYEEYEAWDDEANTVKHIDYSEPKVLEYIIQHVDDDVESIFKWIHDNGYYRVIDDEKLERIRAGKQHITASADVKSKKIVDKVKENSNQPPQITQTPNEKLQNKYKNIVGRGKISDGSDKVRILVKGEENFAGLWGFSDDKMRNLKWYYNADKKRYETKDGKEEYYMIKV